MIFKTCTQCKEAKEIHLFVVNRKKKCGYRAYCISCGPIISRRYYLKNVDKRREVARAYRAAHPDKVKAAWNKWAEPRKQELSRKQCERTKREPEKNRARRSLRRARQAQALAPWANLEKINDIYAEAARLTKETGIKHHVDHIYPIKSKVMCGLHVETNLQILTQVENQKKSNRHWPAQPIEMRV